MRPWQDGCDYAPMQSGNDGVPASPTASDPAQDLPVLTTAEVADFLLNGFWQSYGGARSFDLRAGDVMWVDTSALQSAGQTLARQALQTWSDVTGIFFADVASGTVLADTGTVQLAAAGPAKITFSDNLSGAYASFSTRGNNIETVTININSDWAGGSDRIDGYHYQTYLHEIGHALGLGHAGAYNGSAIWGLNNHYQNDSWQTSLMSYFDQAENSTINDSFAYAVTPQSADILALRSVYGGGGVRLDDTVYGQFGTAGSYLDDLATTSAPVSWTVLDDGGIDTLNYSDTDQHQRIDLTPGARSDVLGLDGNLAIFDGSLIENAMSGTGDDWIGGNDVGNHLLAGAGDDILIGLAGDDLLEGGAGGDLLIGGDITASQLAALLEIDMTDLPDFWIDHFDLIA